MTPDLYLDTSPPPVEKLASETQLSDTADSWPREALKALLEQHPYIGTYETNPVMQKTDGEQGYATGYFQVHNSSATTLMGPGTKAQMAAQGVRFLRIPIIIKSGKLQPFDVFIDAKGNPFPLTDERIRSALFRPQVFDAARTSSGDTGMGGQLYPPTSRQHAMTGGQVVDASQTKLSSVKPQFLLEHIAGSINAGDIARLERMLEKDAQLSRALVHNEVALPFLQFIGSIEPVTAHDVEKVASASIPPTVLQIERDGERYLLKMANDEMFEPEVDAIDRHDAVSLAGEDVVAAADEAGAATISTNPVVHEALEDEEIALVKQFGQYRVKTRDGKEIMGWVFPTVLDYDGESMPFMIFTNGSASAVQPEIVGSFAGRDTNIIKGKPEGYGFFYRVTSTGGVIAFQPTEIRTVMSDEDGVAFMAETMMGEPIKLRLNKAVKAPTMVGDTECAMPADVQWAPLGKEVTPLIENAADFVKTASARRAGSVVQIISDKSTWSFRGRPIEKVAHRWREGLGAGDALFMTCCLGLDPQHGINTLIKAARAGSVSVDGCRPIRPFAEKVAAAREESRKLFEGLSPRPLLLKEAAALEDVTTVDKVLSLGFLNPENVQTFVGWLPELEEALSRLAGLLIAVRLGLEDVPENSVKSAMERLNEVVTGLKKLVFRQQGPEA